MKPGYKQTEVGVIPEAWEVNPLRSCLSANPDYGINAPAVPYSDRLPAYIRITDITEDGRFSSENPVSVHRADTGAYYLNDGDIVFARTGASVGKSYLYKPHDGKLVFAGFLIRVRSDAAKIIPSYLSAYVTTGTYWRWVHLMSMRSGQPGINGQEYGQLPVPLPSLPEQHAIAEALSDVDALIAGLDKLITKKRDLKQAAMQQLLTGKTRLPGFSGRWEELRICDFSSVVTGGTPRTEVSTFWNGDYPWITPTDITERRDMWSSERMISEAGLRSIRQLPANSVLVTCIASIGKNAILRRTGGCNQQINAVVPKKECNPEFCYYLFENSKQYLLSNAGMTATSIISKSTFQQLKFTVPPMPEQTAIAEVLSDMDTEIATLETRLEKTRALKQGMMQELLTGRIRLISREDAKPRSLEGKA
jgi:type I restriction enzyme S subunit